MIDVVEKDHVEQDDGEAVGDVEAGFEGGLNLGDEVHGEWMFAYVVGKLMFNATLGARVVAWLFRPGIRCGVECAVLFRGSDCTLSCSCRIVSVPAQ